MHNVLIISYIAFPIGKLFILPESVRGFGLFEYIAGHIAPLLVTDYSPSAKRL